VVKNYRELAKRPIFQAEIEALTMNVALFNMILSLLLQLCLEWYMASCAFEHKTKLFTRSFCNYIKFI